MQLGISIYPQRASLEENLAYLESASACGFNRLFMALHGGQPDKKALLAVFEPITKRARELGFWISCDVMPQWVEAMGGNLSLLRGPLNLAFFEHLGINALRLDLGMSEYEEAALSKNAADITIELNASLTPYHIDGVLRCGGRKDAIALCHNYYPQPYTGISLNQFLETGQILERYGKKVSAFVSSQVEGAFGPWDIFEGLPTLEMHRNLPIDAQVQHLMASEYCEAIYIGNAFASQQELRAVADTDPNLLCLGIQLADGCPVELGRMVLNRAMSIRPDSGDFLLRTLSGKRLNKEQGAIEPFNTIDIEPGSIIVNNDLFGPYSGEIQIASKRIPNCGRRNVVGRISPDYAPLMNYIGKIPSFSLFEVS